MAKIIDDETMENVCILPSFPSQKKKRKKQKAQMQKMLELCRETGWTGYIGSRAYVPYFQDENVFREDVVTNGDNKEAMLANAPKAKEGQYQVPKP